MSEQEDRLMEDEDVSCRDSQDDITARNYTSADFCAQCRACNLEDIVDGSPPLDRFGKALQIVQGSSCPMCCFFDAAVHGTKMGEAVGRSARFSLRSYGQYQFATLKSAKYRKFLHRDVFLMPFDRIYRSGASRPPGSVGRTDELLVPITYQPPNPRTPDLGLIRTWIKICREKHTKLCSEPDLGLLASIIAIPSFRVIDCSRRSIVKPPATFEYAALSYVWGEPSGTTIDPPCPQPMIVLPEVLPRTIEGAINVAMELGFNYLWVDKYCIDQSTDQHALLMQLSSMDLIYKGAFVTIVAAAGNDAEFGLPGIGPRHRVGHPTVTINNRTWISGSREMQRSVLNSKWTTRGWTYQEAHFSRRLLTFTNEQVLFECNTCRQCEAMGLKDSDIPDHSTDIFRSRPGRPRSRLKLWAHIQLYTQRDLTNQSDVLNALRGLFASFSKDMEPVQQHWGLPMSPEGYSRYSNAERQAWNLTGYTPQSLLYTTLAFGLSWLHDPEIRLKRRDGFPSWSWSGWIGHVTLWPLKPGYPLEERDTFARVDVMRTDSTFEMLTAQLAQSIFEDKNNEASIYTYFLRIEAEILQISFDPSSYPRYIDCTQNSREVEGVSYYWILKLTSSVTPFLGTEPVLQVQTFECIVLNNIYGLVVGTRHGNTERIGRIDLHGKTFSPYDANLMADYCKDVSHLRTYFPGSRRAIVLG